MEDRGLLEALEWKRRPKTFPEKSIGGWIGKWMKVIIGKVE